MRQIEQGEYGWVLIGHEFDQAPRVLWYDDDEYLCICGDESCSVWYDEETDEIIATDEHFPEWLAICYEKPEDLGVTGY